MESIQNILFLQFQREIYLDHGNNLSITQDRTSLISQVVCGKLQRKKTTEKM